MDKLPSNENPAPPQELEAIEASSLDQLVESFSSASGSFKKPVDTLAMTPAEEGRITAVARKLYFTMMWYAQKQGWQPGQESFRAPLAEVLKKIGYTSRNMLPIREALIAMATTPIEWQAPTVSEQSNWGVSGMISHAEILPQLGVNVLEWSYSPKVRPAILEPMPFARGSLEVQAVLSTHASLALYDICSRYLTSSTGLTPRRHWHWWRPVLTGSNDYMEGGSEFKIFNRDVLKKAISAINEKTSIDVEMIAHKAGRFIGDIQFRAKRKLEYKPPLQKVKSEQGLREVGRAIQLGIAQKQAEMFLDSYGEERLAQGLDSFEERVGRKNAEPVKKPAKYLDKVLANTPIDAGTGALVDLKRESDIEKQKRIRLLEQFIANRLQQAWQLFNESANQDKLAMESDFKLRILSKNPPSTQRLFSDKGMKSIAIQSLMKNYLADQYFGEAWRTPSDSVLLDFAMTHGTN